MKGSYLLVFSVPLSVTLHVGKLGAIFFKKAYYVYVGSAMNGLEQRIQRHLRTQKKTHWHVDYLLPVAENIEVFYKESATKDECKIAQILAKNLHNMPSFGCSDCFCRSHLFFGSKRTIMTSVKKLYMDMYHRDRDANA